MQCIAELKWQHYRLRKEISKKENIDEKKKEKNKFNELFHISLNEGYLKKLL